MTPHLARLIIGAGIQRSTIILVDSDDAAEAEVGG